MVLTLGRALAKALATQFLLLANVGVMVAVKFLRCMLLGAYRMHFLAAPGLPCGPLFLCPPCREGPVITRGERPYRG